MIVGFSTPTHDIYSTNTITELLCIYRAVQQRRNWNDYSVEIPLVIIYLG